MEKVGAIIVAAGVGLRMGEDKIFLKLGDKAILAHTIAAFQSCDLVDDIILVLNEVNLEQGRHLLTEFGWSKVKKLCKGGKRRQDSVWQGLSQLEGCRWVVIHDGARPFVTSSLIRHGLAEARFRGAAVAGVPVKDTIKIVGPKGWVEKTPHRTTLWAIQTPQIFRYDLIMDPYRVASEEVTDDASLLEKRGYAVKVFLASYDNIKITTPEDFELAKLILARRQSLGE